jgi:hypothetical protein
MPRRKLTPAEQLVGRALPKEATYRDQLMAAFVKEGGIGCGRMTPSDHWLRPAHKEARQKRWIEAAPVAFSIMGSKPVSIWYLTDAGLEEAKAAKQRVQDARERRRAWSLEWKAVWGQKRQAAPDEAPAQPNGPK